MEIIPPFAVERAQTAAERWNRDKSEICEACTTGKMYRPGETIPHLVFDPSTLQYDRPNYLSVTGKYSVYGSLEMRWVDIRPI